MIQVPPWMLAATDKALYKIVNEKYLGASAKQQFGDVVMSLGGLLHEISQTELEREDQQGNEYLYQEFYDG
jgi:hypothetical protein